MLTLEHSLATLASLAAIALDKRTRSESAEMSAVAELATDLRPRLNRAGIGSDRLARTDPAEVRLFSDALALNGDAMPSSVVDIYRLFSWYVDGLEAMAQGYEPMRGTYRDPTKLMRFCVALSRAAQFEVLMARGRF